MEGLVFAAKAEEDGVLKVGRQDDVLVASLTGQLNAQVPRRQGHERKRRRVTGVGILRNEVVLGVRVERCDGVSEGPSVADMLPCQRCKRGAEGSDGRVDRLDEDGLMVQLYACVSHAILHRQ